MEIDRLFADEGAVSPVIGVILMVAVTVILSAVVGTFALGLGVSQDTAPQATWGTDFTQGGNADELTLAHESGDAMEADRLSVVVTGATCDGGSLDSPKNLADDYSMTGTIGAGGSVTIDGTQLCGGNDIDLDAATVRLVWEDEDVKNEQADSAVLRVWTGPDA
jgi:flagellin-like protein